MSAASVCPRPSAHVVPKRTRRARTYCSSMFTSNLHGSAFSSWENSENKKGTHSSKRTRGQWDPVMAAAATWGCRMELASDLKLPEGKQRSSEDGGERTRWGKRTRVYVSHINIGHPNP